MKTSRIAIALILSSVALSLFLSTRAEAQQGSGTFTIATAPAAGGQVIPTLTWSTSPAGATCTASGDAAWTGSKAASGTQTLPAATPPKSYALACTWPGSTTSKLSWTPPTQNTDGSALTDLAGYRILYGPSATSLGQTIDLPNASLTTYTVTNLTAGNWFFSVRTFNASGVESVNSTVAQKTLAPPMQWTASVGVKVPNPPTNLTAE